jgi:hypothetical protein
MGCGLGEGECHRIINDCELSIVSPKGKTDNQPGVQGAGVLQQGPYFLYILVKV